MPEYTKPIKSEIVWSRNTMCMSVGAIFVAVNVVKPLREMRGQTAVAIALKKDSGAASEHALVGGHPFNTEAVRDRQRLFRNAALRRPNALRTHSKYLLMKIERAH